MPQDKIVIKSADLPTYTPAGGTLRMLTGEDSGLGVCLVVSEYPPGAELPGHRHSNGSAIVVIEGHGAFTVGDSEVGAGAGDIVVIPGNAWHSFRNDGDEWLRLVGVDEGDLHDTELAPSGDA
jgi:quercetin dioxygenase-like cupin family protein